MISMRRARRAAAVLAALPLAVSVVTGCSSSSGGGSPSSGCDAQCQSDLAEADGTSLPPGPAFDLDTSRCALWNKEPSVVTLRLTEEYAKLLGSAHPSFALEHSFQKAITVSCQSYTEDTVKSVAKTLVAADSSWPDA